jgi:hypothetical protein
MWGMSADCRLRRRGGVVTNSPASDTVQRLLGRHGVYYSAGVLPSRADALAALDRDLQRRLRWWLADQGFLPPADHINVLPELEWPLA